ncbi:MFS transporter [Williamsia maris]|uniref:Arabinose efflux permease, MFS family n=1 Tax=Williamsia maris TaxID=72806 RepID=A0ABT1HDR0_9NOCA|nr:MFS transporter [Williamsia maris]MCP2175826.1 putative arabinose efflux permease, MFS family [Williamsia maris]
MSAPPEEKTSARATRYPRALAPFARTQYRFLAMGLVLAMFADGIWTVGVVWQVIALGGGPVQLSFVTGIAAVGMVASTLFGGVLADRMSQRTILIALELIKLTAIGAVGVLAAAGALDLPMLMVVALVGGVTTGIYYPAYSALLPALVPPNELMAANGIEGTLRPVILSAAGPAMAGGLIAVSSPALAIIGSACASAGSAVLYVFMRRVPARRVAEPDPTGTRPVRSTLSDIAAGFSYMWRTPWLLSTLLFASILVMMTMGPIEVLVPFAMRDRFGGDAGSHAMVLAAFGFGGAIGSLLMASLPMPRRYLSVMFAIWGVSSLPMVVFAFGDRLIAFAVAGFVMGLALDCPMVIWGTLLQRRVPPEMLGRVASLDFFVSIAFMPISMAVAAPVAAGIGLTATFLIGGLVPVPLAVIAFAWARLHRDEIANPLSNETAAADPLAAQTR